MSPAPTLQELIDTVRTDAAGSGALEQLTQASRTVAEMEEVSDALLGHFVDRCRRQGHSWSEISAALGVTRQAAHKRFSPGTGGAPSFERFTPRARASLATAAAQAKLLEAQRVGSEHLLLALLLTQDSVAFQVLADLDVTRAKVLEQLGLPADTPGATEARTGSQIGPPAGAGDRQPHPYRPDAIEALRASVEEALALGHNYIGTEHLLLALFTDTASPATTALAALGVLHDQVAARVTALLKGLE